MLVFTGPTDLVGKKLTANRVPHEDPSQRRDVYRQTGHRGQGKHDRETTSSFFSDGGRSSGIGDAQIDFLVPSFGDIGPRDSRGLMNVALFRVSKSARRAGAMIRYNLPNGCVEVKAGPDGMASVWDYDIVLMLVSHLTEAMNRYRDGKGKKPGRVFRPRIADILKFCRRSNGSRQFAEIEAALDRLQGTIIKSVRETSRSDGRVLRTVESEESEGLISSYAVVSRTDTGRVACVEIEVPNWIYREITAGKRPDVLTVAPAYFLISTGIGRFVYRLARQAAGKGQARWSFQTLYARSGSVSSLKEFSRILRKIIAANDLPDYVLREEAGQRGPQLMMFHRKAAFDESLVDTNGAVETALFDEAPSGQPCG
ncbi:replication initiator protein A [Acetobacter orientalis]|uniref:replication initiator protein A n=1 Tax=Acetobacter orientalis TaxID=146474 RepID=UPI0039ED30BC